MHENQFIKSAIAIECMANKLLPLAGRLDSFLSICRELWNNRSFCFATQLAQYRTEHKGESFDSGCVLSA